MGKLIEKLKQRNRRRLPSQVTMLKKSGMAGSIQQMNIDNFSIKQLKAHLGKHPKDIYAGQKMGEKLKQRSRRRLPSQVTMLKKSGMAGRIQQMNIDKFSIKQLQAHLGNHPKDIYAGQKLIEKLKQRNRRRLPPSHHVKKIWYGREHSADEY